MCSIHSHFALNFYVLFFYQSWQFFRTLLLILWLQYINNVSLSLSPMSCKKHFLLCQFISLMTHWSFLTPPLLYFLLPNTLSSTLIVSLFLPISSLVSNSQVVKSSLNLLVAVLTVVWQTLLSFTKPLKDTSVFKQLKYSTVIQVNTIEAKNIIIS